MLSCLECRYFQFQGDFYEQLHGAPMGLSLSVVLANCYMEVLEENVLQSAPKKPALWKRYVDDVFLIWEHGEEHLNEFHRLINSYCDDINFTVEREENGCLPFLDVMVKKQSGRLQTSVFRKPTCSNVYIPYDSHHAPCIKAGTIRCLATRARNIASREDLKTEMTHIKQVFKKNGYPASTIQKAMKMTGRDRDEKPQMTYLSLPYVRGVSEKIGRVLAPHNIRLAHKSRPTLKNLLTKLKDRTPSEERKGAVYKITCECGESYIGESGRKKITRLNEHVSDIKHGRTERSAVADHFFRCHRSLNPMEADTLAIEAHWSRRVVREALEIKLAGSSLNKDVGKYVINPIWDPVLHACK